MLSFKSQIVFGLLVQSVFHSVPTEARWKFSPHHSASNVRQRPQINLRRLDPHLSSLSASNSMANINLNSPSSSSSSIFHSTASLDRANSQSIMRETNSLHRQAASAINSGGMLQPHQRNTLIGRLIPNPERMNAYANYLRNGAIGVAGTGGLVSIARLFGDDSNEKETDDNNFIIDVNMIKTTTLPPNILNPIGRDV